MAVRFLSGFESGDLTDAATTSGTPAVQTSVKRTGSYALAISNGGASEFVQYTGWGADGVITNLSDPTLYYSFWLHVPTGGLPGSDVNIVDIRSAGNAGVLLELGAAGTLQLRYINGSDVSTAVGSAVAISLDTWMRIEIRGTLMATGGSSSVEWRLNGVSQATGTSLTIRSTPNNGRGIRFGNALTVSHTFYVDDLIGATTEAEGWPGVGEVRLLYPDGDSAATQWATGTGATFAEVDDLASGVPDGDTTYIASGTNGQQSRFTLISCATAGITGTIIAVQQWAIVRDVGGAVNVSLRFRHSGSTNVETTGGDPGSTFVQFGKIDVVDADTGVAFTTANLDAAQGGVLLNASVTCRCTAIGMQVYCVPPAGGKGPLLNGGRLINGGITAGRLVA